MENLLSISLNEANLVSNVCELHLQRYFTTQEENHWLNHKRCEIYRDNNKVPVESKKSYAYVINTLKY